MHTAEHILNQAMVRMFQCGRAFSAHIEKKKSKCDYRFDRPLKEGELTELERKVNRVVERNLSVTEELVERSEAEREFDLGRLPEEVNDRIRVVRIGDFDACPCVGQHVSSTGEIGRFRITTSDYTEGVLRIRFKLEASCSLTADDYI